MSLHEVYRLAHTAECRLNQSVSRSDRNLRFVVGHLMHYESLRLRIVEIEHDIDRTHRANATQLHGNAPVEAVTDEQDGADMDIHDDDEFNDADGIDETLGLTRFPSGSSRPPPLMPDIDDDEESDDDAELASPKQPDAATLEQTMKRPADTELAQQLERIRNCPCHGRDNSPQIKNVWELPASVDDKPGVTRVVAQLAS